MFWKSVFWMVWLALLLPLSLYAEAEVVDYELKVRFEPTERSIEGVAVVTFDQNLNSGEPQTFYLHGELAVESIRLGETVVEFDEESVFYGLDYSRVAKKVTLSVPVAVTTEARVLTVQYSGYFNPSKARSPSDYMRIDEGGVFLRAYFYSPWFPVFVEPGETPGRVTFSRVEITTPSQFRSVFTGTLLEESTVGDAGVTVWSTSAIELFEAQVTARPWKLVQEPGYRIYGLEGTRSQAAASKVLGLTRRVVEIYRSRYRQGAESQTVFVMQMPKYGNIASGNTIGMGGEEWDGFGVESYSAPLLAHELVHSFTWVPTALDSDLYGLVIEGFPSYFHLPVLASISTDGETWYQERILKIQEAYLDKRQTGLDSRGRPLPREIPITKMTPENLGEYKDRFVMDDRVLLMFDYLRRQMGIERFDRFAKELLNLEGLNRERFFGLLERHLPGSREDLLLWLDSIEYPMEFRRSS